MNVLQELKTENSAATKYLNAVEKFILNGKIDSAIKMLDVAKCAITLSARAHDELFENAQGNLSDEEWEAFEQSEKITLRFNRIANSI